MDTLRSIFVRLHALLLVVIPLTLAACSADSPPCSSMPCPTDARADAPADAARNDSAPRDVPDPTQFELVSIAIDPAMTTVECTDGMPQMVNFRANGTRRDGATVPVTATWSLADNRLGTISASGVLTVTCLAAGTIQVRAEAAGSGGTMLTAMASVGVSVRFVSAGDGVSDLSMVIGRFAGAPDTTDPAREAHVLYPLDGALMPNNVLAPVIQWERGNENDLYRVQLRKTGVDVITYVRHTGAGFRYATQPSAAAWRSLAESAPGTDITLRVDRLDASANQVIYGTPLTFRLATQGISGVVYYWDLGAGRLLRINAVTGAREHFMPNPPPGPPYTNERGMTQVNRCVACHTISRDGRYLAASNWPAGASAFDLTTDLTGDPPPTTYTTSDANWFATFNPDATRLLINRSNGSLGLIDPRGGASVAATGIPSGTTWAHPEWSPDGTRVALVGNIVDGPMNFSRGDLMLLDASGDTFSGLRTLHAGSTLMSRPEGGVTDAHPSWAPDSRYLAFQHAAHSDMRVPGGEPAALYIIDTSPAGGGRVWALDRASAGLRSYWPTFSPFTTMEPDGSRYFWLAFFSRRDYGNAQSGTRGTGRRQLWVSAVRATPGDGDPSFVPYWLPGQDTRADNMAAYWAPIPCRTNGADCMRDSECCSGRCRPDPAMPSRSTCQPPPPMECRREGQLCGGNADCCMGLSCIGNVCTGEPG